MPPTAVMAGVGTCAAVVLAALVWSVLWRVAADRAALGGLLVTILYEGLVIALLLNVARGRRWARTILTVLVLGDLCALLVMVSSDPHMVDLRWSLSTLPLRIVAVALFFMPSACGWFRTENPVPTAPDGWYPDPLARHERRFWGSFFWTLQVADGQRVRLDLGSVRHLWRGYARDWFAFRDAASAPRGWYADPHGRYEVRFWNGDRWTDLVADAGQMATDETRARGMTSWFQS